MGKFYPLPVELAVHRELRRARTSLSRFEFGKAEAAFRQALSLDRTPVPALEFGRYLRLSGQREAAIEQWNLAWEAARRYGSSSCRRSACLQLAFVWRERGDRLLFRQFHQLAIAASHEELEAAPEGTISHDLFFAHALATLDAGDPVKARAQLQHLVATPSVGDLRVAAQLCLAEVAQSSSETAKHLRAAHHAAHACGDAWGLLRTWEAAATLACSLKQWPAAIRLLESSLALARGLPHSSQSELYARCLIRLRRGVALIHGDPQRN